MKRAGALALASLLTYTRAPGAHPAPLPEARERAEDSCPTCHSAIAGEWNASLHRASFSDASFQRGYAHEPQAFCRACHAPESNAEREPTPFAAAHGVACVTCHVPRTGAARPSGRDGHPALLPAPEVRASCNHCHEFAIPGSAARGEVGLMQKTVTEHARSGLSKQSCVDCHMPKENGHTVHSVAASRDESVLRAALRVEARQSGPHEVVVTLHTNNVGHAFPTGDMFRELAVTLWRADQPVGEEILRRTFATAPTQVETSDTRIVGTRVVRFRLASATTEPLTVRVTYRRVTEAAPDRARTLAHAQIELARIPAF